MAEQDEASFPLAAQIPLRDFTLPHFPPEASRLRELTLTCDIKLDEYQSLVSSAGPGGQSTTGDGGPANNLPPSITSLTLELFSLGFPKPFLSELAAALPNLRCLTLFSCLVDGIDAEARADAEAFFAAVPLLTELHIIDSFARPGFWTVVGEAMEGNRQGLKVVDVSYTFRGHEDCEFLARIQGEELVGLISSGAVGLGFNLIPPPATDEGDAKMVKERDAENGQRQKDSDGILSFASDGRSTAALRKRFDILGAKHHLKEVKVLNLCLWTLRPAEVGAILHACGGQKDGGLVDLTVSVLMEEGWWAEVISGLESNAIGKGLESLEIVGVPARAKEEGDDWSTAGGLIEEKDIESLGNACPKLARFAMSILRARGMGGAAWIKNGSTWERQ